MRGNKLIVMTMAVLIFLSGCGKADTVTIDGDEYPIETQTLDLSGQTLSDYSVLEGFTALQELDIQDTGITPEQYQTIQAMLPECDITWSVPFQGSYYNNCETTELEVDSLSEEDAKLLSLFPELEKVDVAECDSFLREFMAQEHPYKITYTVSVGGVEYSSEHSEPITVADPDLEELKEKLPLLPEVHEVALTGALPGDDQLLALKQALPEVDFAWDLTVYGVATNTMAIELNLDRIRLQNADELESKLPLFNQLEVVNMNKCGLSNDYMAALRDRHPEVKIVWTVVLNDVYSLRTDAKYFMPNRGTTYKMNDEACNRLRYCTDLVCIDLGHHNVGDLTFLDYLPNVQYLVLADTKVLNLSHVAQLKELKYLELFLTSAVDYWPLLNCTNLEYLNICWMGDGDMTPISQMTWLKQLWVGTYGVSKEDKALLIDNLPNTHINFSFNAKTSTAYGWRHTPGYYEMRDIMEMYYMYG